MRNLAEPGSKFRAAAPNHPEAFLEQPHAFQAAGEKVQCKSFISLITKDMTDIEPIYKNNRTSMLRDL